MQPITREPILQVNTSRGDSITTPFGQITPVARVVKLRWPGGGLNWNRPAAVEIEQGQSWQRIPINDATSRTIFTIVLTGLAVALGMSAFLKRRRNKHD